MTKILVIGLDGATWNLIMPLINKGKLKTIKKLLKDGSWANLQSSIPHITFPAWRCYSSGKNPGKLGVYGFVYPNFHENKYMYNNSKSFKSNDYWDFLGNAGFKCGVIGMPSTYPPNKINGCMVSELTSKDRNYTYPTMIEKELKEKFDYNSNLLVSFKTDPKKAGQEAINIINQRFDVATYLNKKFNFDLLNLVIFHIDDIQHYAWKFWEDKSEDGNILEDSWQIIDNRIDKFINIDSDNFKYIFIISDHGFTQIDMRFNLSEWLIKKEYLKINNKFRLLRLLYKLGITKEKMLKIVEKVKLRAVLERNIPYSLLQKAMILPSEEGQINDSTELGKIIDWERSLVITNPIGDGMIYINPKKYEYGTKEYNKFRDKLIQEIGKIENPKNKKRIANKIFKKEELYSGPYTYLAPDVIILPNEGCHIPTTIDINSKIWLEDDTKTFFSANHKLHGIFLAHGPGIKKNQKIENAKIYDLAPTILHLFGLPIPNDMDGRVLTELFEEDSELIKRKPNYLNYNYSKNKKNILSSRIETLRKKVLFRKLLS